MQNAAQEGLRKYGNDPVLKFFNAYSLILEGTNHKDFNKKQMSACCSEIYPWEMYAGTVEAR